MKQKYDRDTGEWYDEKVKINFADNWNGKLTNDYFTTIRRNEINVKEGDIAEICVRSKKMNFDVEVVKIIKTRLDKIPDLLAYLDFGKSKDELIDYLQRAYSENLNKGFMYVYLLKNVSKELPF